MKKIYIIIFLILLIITVGILFLPKKSPQKENSIVPEISQPENKNTDNFQPPLDRAGERVTKKTFGMYITLQNSPVQPERFEGYHTGVDFEIFPEELNAEVFVRATCSGSLRLKKYADGYGGAMVQECELNKEQITVIYGHLKLSSITATTGENINVGDVIGILGANQSTETSGERKHLHLGFYGGEGVDIRGYVQNQSELSQWIDPCIYICSN